MGGNRGFGQVAAAVVVTAALLAAGTPAHADDTVTVPGISFPDPTHASLSFVGCEDLYQRGEEQLVPMVGHGPGQVPAGDRSLGFDLAGGDAAGAMFVVDSVLGTTTAGLSVHADGPATGVAYAGYQPPSDAGTSLLWIGRADLSTPGGSWQRVDVAGRAYVWTQYDMSTHQVVQAGPGGAETVPTFAATNGGDGPGLFSVGFGCDGTPFSVDALRVGGPGTVTTFDLEGLTSTISVGNPTGGLGGPRTLVATLESNTGDPVPNATLILERSSAPTGPWTTVQVQAVDDGQAAVTVDPSEKTYYRWRFVDRPLASGSVSRVVEINGSDPTPSPTPDPTPHPTRSPQPSPSPGPTSGPTSGPPSPSPSELPSESPTSAPSSTATDPEPTISPTDVGNRASSAMIPGG